MYEGRSLNKNYLVVNSTVTNYGYKVKLIVQKLHKSNTGLGLLKLSMSLAVIYELLVSLNNIFVCVHMKQHIHLENS